MTTIIVVESNRLLRTAIAQYLKGQGYSVLEAEEAQTALSLLEQKPVQALLLDTHPAPAGTELLRQIRKRPALAQLPVIALVASHLSPEALDYLKPGDYLSIPFDMAHLAWRLKQLLAGLTSAEPCAARAGPTPIGQSALSGEVPPQTAVS
jgi:DNA-binding response OmpR family regulator